MLDPRLLLLSTDDNVFVLRAAIDAGERVALEDGGMAVLPERLGMGHKIARWPIAVGARIVKYGAPIGSATQDIPAGAHVHIHNVKSDHTPSYALPAETEDAVMTMRGWPRSTTGARGSATWWPWPIWWNAPTTWRAPDHHADAA